MYECRDQICSIREDRGLLSNCVLSKLAIPVLPLNAATEREWVTVNSELDVTRDFITRSDFTHVFINLWLSQQCSPETSAGLSTYKTARYHRPHDHKMKMGLGVQASSVQISWTYSIQCNGIYLLTYSLHGAESFLRS